MQTRTILLTRSYRPASYGDLLNGARERVYMYPIDDNAHEFIRQWKDRSWCYKKRQRLQSRDDIEDDSEGDKLSWIKNTAMTMAKIFMNEYTCIQVNKFVSCALMHPSSLLPLSSSHQIKTKGEAARWGAGCTSYPLLPACVYTYYGLPEIDPSF